jgi:hypothetical protein
VWPLARDHPTRVMASRRVGRDFVPLGFNKWKSGIPLPRIATLGIPFH